MTRRRCCRPQAETGRDGLRFADWYRSRTDLRERGQIQFVTPQAAREESVLTTPSRRHDDCGLVAVDGGVSLANLGERLRRSGVDTRSDLPATVRRAGVYDRGPTYNQTTGTGSMKQLFIDDSGTTSSYLGHEITRPNRATARIEVTANPSGVTPLGALKEWRATDAPRGAVVELRAGHGEATQGLRLQGQDLGAITATRHGDLVTLRWRSGIVDRVTKTLESVQRRLSKGHGARPVDGVLYGMRNAGGDILYRVGDTGEPWLSITSDATASGDLAFRLGAPGNPGVRHLYGKLVPGPAYTAGESLTVTPATPGSAAVAKVDVNRPAGTAVTVTTRDGRTSTLHYDGVNVRAPPTDPVLGLDGSTAGAALLGDYPRVADSLRESTDTGDGLLRGVLLGDDGAALVGDKRILLLESGDPWTEAVARASTPTSPSPLFAQYGSRLAHQANVPVRPVSETGASRLLGDVLADDAVVLLDDALRTSLALDDGPVLAETLPHEREVVVAEAELPGDYAFGMAVPDLWVADGHTWWRVVDGPTIVDGPGRDDGDAEGGGSSGGGTGRGGDPHGAPQASTTTSPRATRSGRPHIVLVCDEDAAEACA